MVSACKVLRDHDEDTLKEGLFDVGFSPSNFQEIDQFCFPEYFTFVAGVNH